MPLSHAARVIASSPTPVSYDGDKLLIALNLFVMLAGSYLAMAAMIAEGWDLWRYQRIDRWDHPVTANRAKIFFAAMAAVVRCGAEAATILGWDPRDPVTGAVILNLKHYLDPLSVACLFCWLTLHIVSKRAVNRQLRQEPIQIKIWATLPQLVRPVLVVIVVAVMSFGVVYLRGR